VSRALFAISGQRFYEVVGLGCPVGRRSEQGGLRLVAFGKDGRYAGLVRRLAREPFHRPFAVSAAGNKVAIVDSARGGPWTGYTVTVIGPHGSHVKRFSRLRNWWRATTVLQSDDAGDVFEKVIPATPQLGPPGGYANASGVVVPSRGAPFELPIQITYTPHVGLVFRTAASMSEGRLAFLPSTEEIEVMDVASRGIVGKVRMAPGNEILGIALEGTELTWMEQPVAYALRPPEPSNPNTGPLCSWNREPTGPPSIERMQVAEIETTTPMVGSSPAPVTCTMGPAPP
jgi:hypothetical protein